MSTVSRPRAPRKARPPRPSSIPAEPAPEITESIPEGWERGGSQPPEPAPSGPPVRHGSCSLTLSIGGTRYRLSPALAGPPIEAVWCLRKIQPDPLHEPVAYAVASDGLDVHCTCPDHTHNGASCKHMMALIALRLIPAPARPSGPEGGAR